MKKYLPVLLAVLVVMLAVQVLARFRGGGDVIAEGQRAPDFTLSDLEGNSVSLSDVRGKVVMLNFWSAACPPCREEMPGMQRVFDDLAEQGFTILAVNVNDLPLITRNFLQQNGYTFPVLMDDGKVGRLYEVQYIPKTILLDREGIIRHVRVGPITEEELRTLAQQYL